jgi:hypothetical protein
LVWYLYTEKGVDVLAGRYDKDVAVWTPDCHADLLATAFGAAIAPILIGHSLVRSTSDSPGEPVIFAHAERRLKVADEASPRCAPFPDASAP